MPRRSLWPWSGLWLALLACACLVPLWGCKPKRKEAPKLRLSISSDPPGADVILDDHPAGGKTPLRGPVRKVRHMVEIALEGYETV